MARYGRGDLVWIRHWVSAGRRSVSWTRIRCTQMVAHAHNHNAALVELTRVQTYWLESQGLCAIILRTRWSGPKNKSDGIEGSCVHSNPFSHPQPRYLHPRPPSLILLTQWAVYKLKFTLFKWSILMICLYLVLSEQIDLEEVNKFWT